MEDIDFISYLANNKTNEMEKMNNFALDALIFSCKVQTFHWSCESGFHHEHFEKIYEIIRDFADKLVETIMSNGIKFKIFSKTYLISDEEFVKENAILKIENFRDTLKDYVKSFKTSSVSLENLFSDTIEQLDKEIGLIKNFN